MFYDRFMVSIKENICVDRRVAKGFWVRHPYALTPPCLGVLDKEISRPDDTHAVFKMCCSRIFMTVQGSAFYPHLSEAVDTVVSFTSYSSNSIKTLGLC